MWATPTFMLAVVHGAIIYQGKAVRTAASRVNTRSDVICGDSDAHRALKPSHFVPVRMVLRRFYAFWLE